MRGSHGVGVSGKKIDSNPSTLGWIQGRLPEEQAGGQTVLSVCLLIASQSFAVCCVTPTSPVTTGRSEACCDRREPALRPGLMMAMVVGGLQAGTLLFWNQSPKAEPGPYSSPSPDWGRCEMQICDFSDGCPRPPLHYGGMSPVREGAYLGVAEPEPQARARLSALIAR